jgi:hypothetical protein
LRGPPNSSKLSRSSGVSTSILSSIVGRRAHTQPRTVFWFFFVPSPSCCDARHKRTCLTLCALSISGW